MQGHMLSFSPVFQGYIKIYAPKENIPSQLRIHFYIYSLEIGSGPEI